MPRKNDAHKDELEGVAQRLRSARPEASPLELDRIKTTAMSRARAVTGRAGARRLAVAGLTVGLMAAGTGGVIAGVGSSNTHGNAATAQYGKNCEAGNGDGNGNGSHNGNGNGNTVASFGRSGGHHGHGGKHGGSGNGSGNGNTNGNGNGNDNGNESGNDNGNFNCNDNSFNGNGDVNGNGNTITTNNITNNITNNFNTSPVTITVPPSPTSSVLGSTTTKAKTSSRRIKIHIRIPRKARLKKVTLKINGKVISVLKGKKASANINLVNLPCSKGATTVVVIAVTDNGKTIEESRQFHLCQA
jgi:hypothetical protein